MARLSRRTFLLMSAALPVGCAINPGDGPAAPAAAIREPAIGQTWRYAKHDYFTKAIVDTQVDEVTAVGPMVEINSHTEATQPAHTGTNHTLAWLQNIFSHPHELKSVPSEYQLPWGMIVVDPHWGQVQVYEKPIPLWPTKLEPGWHAHIDTRYKTSEEAGLPWDQTMKAEAWETVTVPAGAFRTLRYTNLINFTSSDLSRTHSIRRETIWLAPELGRWVARESHGTYYFDESTADDQNQESGYRWELLSWT